MKQPINEEKAKKVAIIILIVSAILNFIGILCIIGFATKKIEIVKAEEQEQVYYQFNMPQSISINDMNSIITSQQSYVDFRIENETSTQGIMYNDNNYNYQYTIYSIRVLTNYENITRAFQIAINSNETDPVTRAITVYYQYSNESTQWEYSEETSFIGNQNTEITLQNFLTTIWKKGNTLDNYLTTNNLNTKWQTLLNIDVLREVQNTIQLTTPTITKNGYVIEWQTVEHAEYYNIFRNGNLHGQTQLNQWICSENGTYTIQACTTEEGYSNSEISNSVSITEYNDIIGNGWNFYTLIGAVLDSEIILFKSLLNYEIWGINLFQAVQIILTGCLVLLIIKKFVL